jgi:hypothetical protein
MIQMKNGLCLIQLDCREFLKGYCPPHFKNMRDAVEDVGSYAHDIPKAEHPKCEPCFHPNIKKQLSENILFII